MHSINVAKQFSRLPGPRYRHEGPYSGEEFRERLLRPAFERGQATGERLHIELDGVEFGYPTSFLEEAFGGLARALGSADVVLNGLEFHATEDPLLEREIHRYIKHAFELKPPQVA